MDGTKTVKERLIAFIAYLNIGQGKFEKNCGLANAYVANIRKSITPEKLQQISQHYPELNTGWLMTGEGEMLRNPSQSVGDVKGSTIVGANVNGSGNNISNNDAIALSKAIDEISEMRKIIQEQVKNNQQQFERMMAVIEQLTK